MLLSISHREKSNIEKKGHTGKFQEAVQSSKQFLLHVCFQKLQADVSYERSETASPKK